MKSVLVVDDDRVLLDALALELSRLGYAARTAASVDEAVDQLATRPADVLVTDLRMRGRDGIDLLRACREMHPRTRMVLMSAYATARDYKVARSVGAVEVLVKPFAPEEFAEAVRRAGGFDAGFQADVLGLTLVDVLQLFHHGRRTVSVKVGETGVIHMRDGEIVHATSATGNGPTALIEILSVEGGVISTGAPEHGPRTLTRPFETLLLGTLALIDERRASRPVHDNDIFTSAQPQAMEGPTSDPPARPSGVRTRVPEPVDDPVPPAVVPPPEPSAVSLPVEEPANPGSSRGLGLALLAVFAVVLLVTLGRDPSPQVQVRVPPGGSPLVRTVRVSADEVVGVGMPDAPGPQLPLWSRPGEVQVERPAPTTQAAPETRSAPTTAAPAPLRAPISKAAPPSDLEPVFAPPTRAPETRERPIRVVRVGPPRQPPSIERPAPATEGAPATAAPPSAAPETRSVMPQVEILEDPPEKKP